MMHINRVEIDGYKGLESIDIDLNDLNLISGRNNTGKSSVLEAVELAYQPRALRDYEENVGKLINIHKERASIKCYSDELDRFLYLRKPDREEVPAFLSETVSQVIERNMEGRERHPIISFDDDTRAEIRGTISETYNTFFNSLEEDELNSLGQNMIVLELDSDEYPYVYFGESIQNLVVDNRHSVIESVMDRMDDEVEELIEEMSPIPPKDTVEDMVMRSLGFPHSEGYFLEPIENTGGVTYVRDPTLEDDFSPGDDSEAAVKKVEIRDYLREAGIVTGLEDFEFGDLVFEDEKGTRYSIPYDFMGDGFKTIVGILWQFMNPADVSEILLLEEPENHMHPGFVHELVPFLIQVAREEDVQLFITTHNIDFIKEFFSANRSPEELEFLEDGFELIQMSELVPKTFDYSQAEEQVEELHMDLRGI